MSGREEASAPPVVRVTVEPSAWGWEVFPWDERGEAWAIPARTTGAVRAIVREVRQGRRAIPVTWLRAEAGV